MPAVKSNDRDGTTSEARPSRERERRRAGDRNRRQSHGNTRNRRNKKDTTESSSESTTDSTDDTTTSTTSTSSEESPARRRRTTNKRKVGVRSGRDGMGRDRRRPRPLGRRHQNDTRGRSRRKRITRRGGDEREILRTDPEREPELQPDVDVEMTAGPDVGEANVTNTEENEGNTADNRRGGQSGAHPGRNNNNNSYVSGNQEDRAGYYTRSKGHAGMRGHRASSTPNKTRGIKDSWTDLQTDEDDEEGQRGRHGPRDNRRRVSAQHQRREREKQQSRNRDWISKSFNCLPAVGEEPALGQMGPPPPKGPTVQRSTLRDFFAPSSSIRQAQPDPGRGLSDMAQATSGATATQVVATTEEAAAGQTSQPASNVQGCSIEKPAEVALPPLPPLCPTGALKVLADVVNDRCAGGGGDILDSEEEDMEEIDGQFVRIDGMLDTTMGDPDQSVILDVGDLVSPDAGIDIGGGGQIRATEIVPFVVLKYDPRVDKFWTVPKPELFQELMARVAGIALELDISCYKAYRWATLWGKVGLLGLASSNIQDIKDYRQVIEEQMSGPVRFTIFPKDALERRGNLTVLLRENLRHFNVLWLPKAILIRSRMRGGLRITHIKHYHSEDRTREGLSKEGWRLALLQGCPEFMDELKRFDADHRFPIGAGHVVIRGGSGRPKGTVDRNRGARGGGKRPPGPQQLHHPRQEQQAQEGQRRGTRGGNERNYNRDYPVWGRNEEDSRKRSAGREKEHDRVRDRSAVGTGGSRGQSANAAGGNGPGHRLSGT